MFRNFQKLLWYVGINPARPCYYEDVISHVLSS